MLKFIKGLKTKTKVILVVIAVLVIMMIFANVQHAKNQKLKEQERQQELLDSQNSSKDDDEDEDTPQKEAKEEQTYLNNQYGTPPKGFKWNDDGNLVAISSKKLTAEEVAYAYLKGVSILDFETVEKYSQDSKVVGTYGDSFGDDAEATYYDQFLRKVYKQSLLSLEVDSLKDSSVFASGKRIMTFSLNILDLTNKDFWLKDKKAIFDELHNYAGVQKDSTKAKQYLYDYCLKYYQSKEARKHNVQIDLVITKVKDGGWLVTDDSDIDKLASYEDGTLVVDYIWDAYQDYSEGLDN